MTDALEWIFTLADLNGRIFKQLDRQLSVHGFSFSEFYILHRLAEAPKRTMRRIDLAETVGMSASGITRALNPMEKLGLVLKEQNPRDARVSFVRLSDTGLERHGEALATVRSALTALLSPLDEAAMDAFMALARKLK